ncbi:MAG: hypothetical protein ABIR71_09215 [Chthoniobacterales bacterium]
MPKFYIKTYGCQMNERDSEQVAHSLIERGYQPATSEAEADVVLLNTCRVRDMADQKALGKMGMLGQIAKRRSEVEESEPLLPIVIAAARDQERFAQPRHFVLAAHDFDSGIPLGGTSERMPRDFFSTSLCSNSFAFSCRKRWFSTSNCSTLRLRLRPL